MVSGKYPVVGSGPGPGVHFPDHDPVFERPAKRVRITGKSSAVRRALVFWGWSSNVQAMEKVSSLGYWEQQNVFGVKRMDAMAADGVGAAKRQEHCQGSLAAGSPEGSRAAGRGSHGRLRGCPGSAPRGVVDGWW